MLIILQELMYRAYVETEGKPPKRDEIPKPCEYFDLIAGTGTGGLIALMLGRLRLDIETCMEVYVRMTKKVFETDKTIAGIPYKHTLFKASKLEEAIKQCVAEHTVYEDEGNDGTARGGRDFSSSILSPSSPVGRSMSVRSVSSLASPATARTSMLSTGSGISPMHQTWGNPNASLYDNREFRTKTAVTAVFKDTDPKTGASILLRSYDSRREPPPEFNCSIWQAGRATCATGLAFKPIAIGQSVFIDQGAGKYNPSPQILEEAVVNEWPGRELGIFVSIGTGKRPGGTKGREHEWWEGFVGGSMGAFAEARRRLIAKIEGCEDTHMQMLNIELPKRQIPRENYARLNVEVGVGEFGMNEWDRLSDMTIGTRRYLKKEDTQEIIQSAAFRMAKIQLAHRRMSSNRNRPDPYDPQAQYPVHSPIAAHQSVQQGNWPPAVELPAELPTTVSTPLYSQQQQQPHRIQQPPLQFRPAPPQTQQSPPYPDDVQSYSSHTSSNDKFAVIRHNSNSDPPRASHESARQSPYSNANTNPSSFSAGSSDYRVDSGINPPPRPPKTPINDPMQAQRQQQLQQQLYSPVSASPRTRLPYPLNDEGPPPVNKARKPTYTVGGTN